MVDPNLTEANQKIQDAIEYFKGELSAIRAGRANPSLVENIPVDAYGSKMKLMEVGTISSPQPTLLTIQVWDASLVNAVSKAIMESSLGLTPATEGQLIRLPIPPLTQERREEFIKLVHKKLEDARIEIRQIRQDCRKEWDRAQDEGEISQDELVRREKLLQELVDKKMEEVEQLGNKKEEELLQV